MARRGMAASTARSGGDRHGVRADPQYATAMDGNSPPQLLLAGRRGLQRWPIPIAGLIMDGAGNRWHDVHGRRQSRRHHGQIMNGVAFELTPEPGRTAWTENVLHRFFAGPERCADGAAPLPA